MGPFRAPCDTDDLYAKLCHEACEGGIELFALEAILHFKMLGTELDNILGDVLVAQDAVRHEGSKLCKVVKGEAEAYHSLTPMRSAPEAVKPSSSGVA